MATAMTVKEVSRTTGLSRETLRYYESTGLLREPRRGPNGYRYFDENDLNRLRFILKTKKAGFKIREIKELLSLKSNGKATCRLGRDMALERIQMVDQKIASLIHVRAILQEFADRCEAVGLDEPCSLSFHLDPLPFPSSQK